MFASDKLPEVEGVTFKHYLSRPNNTYYYGYCIDLIYEINETMNFEFELREPQDGAYGTMQIDGSWNGMIRELIDDVSQQIMHVFCKFQIILSAFVIVFCILYHIDKLNKDMIFMVNPLIK